MKLEFCKFNLIPNSNSLNAKSKKNTVESTVLKFTFDKTLIGYSAMQTWVGLGDPSVEEILKNIVKLSSPPFKSESQIAENVTRWAYEDALARQKGNSIFKGLDSYPINHYLITDPTAISSGEVQELINDGFNVFKIKFKNDSNWAQSVRDNFLNKKLKIRLDFNAFFTKDKFLQFVFENEDIFHQCDFVEDPCVFNTFDWVDIKQKSNINLALDFHLEQGLSHSGSERAIDVIVVKPLSDNISIATAWTKKYDKKITFTSYMDHPLGQMFALYDAVKSNVSLDSIECGLMTHLVYKKNSFSDCLPWSGQQLVPLNDIGVGFTDELSKLSWVEFDK